MREWQEPIFSIHALTDDQTQHFPDYRHIKTDNMTDVLDPSVPSSFHQPILDALEEFSAITSPTLTPTHMTEHCINTGEALPTALREYQCPVAWEDKFQQELHYLKESNLIKPSTALWASPMFPLPKKNGDIKFVTEPDPYSCLKLKFFLKQSDLPKFSPC